MASGHEAAWIKSSEIEWQSFVGAVVCIAVAVTGCSHPGAMATGDGGVPGGDSGAPISDAGAPDGDAGAPDGMMPAGSQLVVEDGFAPITQWSFTDTPPGGSAAITLLVRNAAATASGPLALSLTVGAGDAQFAIDDSGSSCHDGLVLAATAQCWVRLVFTAGTAGTATASLQIAGGAALLTLPLAGRTVAATGIMTSPSTLDFGVVVLGDAPGVVAVTLTNTTATAITLLGSELPADISFPPDSQTGAGTTLNPGISTTLKLQYQPLAPGTLATSAVIETTAGPVAVPLHALAPYRLIVGLLGAQAAQITSMPAGVGCSITPNSGCSGLVFGPVTLFATSSDGSVFQSWELPSPVYSTATCGATASCAVPSSLGLGPNAPLVLARFASGTTTPAVHLTIAGAGHGYVHADATSSVNSDVTINLGTCRASCDLAIPADASLVTLTSYTTETFTGWTGSLGSTASRRFAFPATNLPSQLTAVFDLDPREQATLVPDQPTTEIAWAPDGDLVIAGRNTVTKLTPDGQVVWATVLRNVSPGARTLDLAVAATGEIDVVTVDPSIFTLHQLSAAGQVRWSRVFVGAVVPEGVDVGDNDDDVFAHYVVAAANGDIALRLAQNPSQDFQVVVLHNDGTPAWTAETGELCSGIAAGPDGSYYVTVLTDGEQNGLLRYAADGTPLADFGTIAGANWFGALAVDAAGDIALSGTEPEFSANEHTIVLLQPDASAAFALAFPIGRRDDTQGVNSGIVFDASGDLVTAREADPMDDTGQSGVLLQQWSPAGDSLWTVDKPSDPDFVGQIVGSGLAADAAHHVAIAGNGLGLPWIEIFAMP